MRTQLIWLVPLVFSLSGCQGDSEGGSEPTPQETVPGCECILYENAGYGGPDPQLPVCGGELLCPIANPDDATGLYDPDELECILTALRDQTPGLLRWKLSEGGGQSVYNTYLLIQADGRAVHRTWGLQDLSYQISEAKLGPLEPATTFDVCLGVVLDGDLEAPACLRRPLASEDALCDETWSEDIF